MTKNIKSTNILQVSNMLRILSNIYFVLFYRTVKAVRMYYASKQYLPDKDGLETRYHLHVTQGHVLHCKGPCTKKAKAISIQLEYQTPWSLTTPVEDGTPRSLTTPVEDGTPWSLTTPGRCHSAESQHSLNL